MSSAKLVCDISAYHKKKGGKPCWCPNVLVSFLCSWIAVHKQTCSFFPLLHWIFFFKKKWQLPLFLNTTYALLNVPCGQSPKHRAVHICFSSFLTISLPYFNKQLPPEEYFWSTISLFLGAVKIAHEQVFHVFLCKLFSQDFKFVNKPTGK